MRGQHDVSRFDIAMDDALRMRKIQTRADLPHNVDRLRGRNRPLSTEKGFESCALDELHGQI